jgi:hypothetical protein
VLEIYKIHNEYKKYFGKRIELTILYSQGVIRAPCGARPLAVRSGPAPPPPLHHRIGILFNLHGSSSYASSFGIPSHFKLGYNHEALHSYNPNPIDVSDPIIVRTTISDFSYLPKVEYQTNIKKLLTINKKIIPEFLYI